MKEKGGRWPWINQLFEKPAFSGNLQYLTMTHSTVKSNTFMRLSRGCLWSNPIWARVVSRYGPRNNVCVHRGICFRIQRYLGISMGCCTGWLSRSASIIAIRSSVGYGSSIFATQGPAEKNMDSNVSPGMASWSINRPATTVPANYPSQPTQQPLQN